MKEVHISKGYVRIDDEEFVSLAHLRKFLAEEHCSFIVPAGKWMKVDGAGKKEGRRDPLELDIYLGYDAQDLNRPTMRASFSQIVEEILCAENEGGYEGWPGVKLMRDRMARLIAQMDAWDARAKES